MVVPETKTNPSTEVLRGFRVCRVWYMSKATFPNAVWGRGRSCEPHVFLEKQLSKNLERMSGVKKYQLALRLYQHSSDVWETLIFSYSSA